MRSDIASLEASDAAIIQDESATVGCFLEPHEMAALMYLNTWPEVECFTAQSESDMPYIRW